MKELLSTKLGKTCATIVLLLFVFWLVLQFRPELKTWVLLDPILLALVLTAVALVAIDLGFKAWQRRRQAGFDARMAAREGIEDRRREWAEWTAELRRQGIDRYQLPMYLLVGEPQSGKSIMLRNSDLHFPFGQNRLSGVGGTRGCDWWFTDQAVILDLAGRLFTHEGGASDEAEWTAFLEMLADYRPQCPANGVILVLPCDGLASDAEPVITKKAAKMQAALLTLTNRLQARLPVYVVLTKADKVFGFAECVHRLDAEKRHEMFGWSRPLEKLEAPFDVEEARAGFLGTVERGRLLRSQMLATARIPEALSEVDRFYAFPEELAALWPMLGLYLQRIFTQSQLIDQLFFRGVYLTSGLQSGAPIAKVCAELLGSNGEADRRNLEGLFTKQRAYFIKELVRERIFPEQGLVRPTRQRVVRARRMALIGYGLAGVIALVSIGWSAWDIRARMSDEEVPEYEHALSAYKAAKGDPESFDKKLDATEVFIHAGDVNRPLQEDVRAATQAFVNNNLISWVRDNAASAFAGSPLPSGHQAFLDEMAIATRLLNGLDLNDPEQRRFLDRLSLEPGKTERLKDVFGSGYEFELLKIPSDERQVVIARAIELWDGTLTGGSGWATTGALGIVLASNELSVNGRYKKLEVRASCDDVYRHANAIDLLFHSQDALEKGKDESSVSVSKAKEELKALKQQYAKVAEADGGRAEEWSKAKEVLELLDGDQFPLHPSLAALLKDAELGNVCAPSFLAKRKASTRPNELLLDLAARPTGGDAAAVFDAKCGCIAQAYIEAFPRLVQLRAALAHGDSQFAPEISEHLGGLEKALSSPTLGEWREHVHKLIDAYEGELLTGWKSKQEDLRSQLTQHLEQVSPSVDTLERKKWLAEVVELLAGELGNSVDEAVKNFFTFTNLGRDSGERYIKTLRDGVQRLGSGSDGRELSGKLVQARASAQDPPQNGSGWYVEQLFKAFCEVVLREEVRRDFRADLEMRIGRTGSNSGLIEALWGTGEGEVDLQFFDRGGGFDKLWDGYHVRRAPGIPPDPEAADSWTFEQFRPRIGDEVYSEMWNALGFLRELQGFVLAGGDHKSAASSAVKVSIDCDESSAVFQRGGNFYVGPGFERVYERIVKKGMKLVDLDWSLKETELHMRWSKLEDEFKNFNSVDGDYHLERRGPFAIMRLAWEGQKSEDVWQVVFDTDLKDLKGGKKEKLPGAMALQFERSLPERPKEPPFPLD